MSSKPIHMPRTRRRLRTSLEDICMPVAETPYSTGGMKRTQFKLNIGVTRSVQSVASLSISRLLGLFSVKVKYIRHPNIAT